MGSVLDHVGDPTWTSSPSAWRKVSSRHSPRSPGSGWRSPHSPSCRPLPSSAWLKGSLPRNSPWLYEIIRIAGDVTRTLVVQEPERNQQQAILRSCSPHEVAHIYKMDRNQHLFILDLFQSAFSE